MSGETFNPGALSVGAIVDDRFEIIEKLGEGGMGAIFKARQLSMDRMVALKVLLHDQRGDPISVERFRHEAYLASRLKHPNAIVIHDFGQSADGLLYIAMEFLAGDNLKTRLRQTGAMLLDTAVRIMTQTLRTIAEAHRMGMVHRDLKPENIFLTKMEGDPDYVKVLDFGIAKLTANSEGVDGYQGGLTVAGKIYGTPNYMSPEQIRGKVVDQQSDLYSLGVIFYECLSGRMPFVAQTPVDVMMMHLRDQPQPITELREEVPTRLAEVVMRGLEKDRRNRYGSADEFLAALDEALDMDSGTHRPVRDRRLSGPQQALSNGSASGPNLVEPSLSGPNAPGSGAHSGPRSGPEDAPDVSESTMHNNEELNNAANVAAELGLGDDLGFGDENEERTFLESDSEASLALMETSAQMPEVALPTPASGAPDASVMEVEEFTMLELDDEELEDLESSLQGPPTEIAPTAPGPLGSEPTPRRNRSTLMGPPGGVPGSDDALGLGARSGNEGRRAPKSTLLGQPVAPPTASAPMAIPDGPTTTTPEAPKPPPPVTAPPERRAPMPEPEGTNTGPVPAITEGKPPKGKGKGKTKGGSRKKKRSGSKKGLIFALLGVIAIGAGVAAVLILDPFGLDKGDKPDPEVTTNNTGGGSTEDPTPPKVVEKPKLIVGSSAEKLDVFDAGSGVFLGSVPPGDFELDEGVTATDLRLLAGRKRFSVKLPASAAKTRWVYIELPPKKGRKSKKKLAPILLTSTPEGAAVKIGEVSLGRTPLAYVGPIGSEITFEVTADGLPPKTQAAKVKKAGETIQLDLKAQ